jgi:hypothetical protein
MKILVINRKNHMGDAMCQMRGLKEWKDAHPNDTLEFASCLYLHVLMAAHTDLFARIHFDAFDQINALADNYHAAGYDGLIEFEIDWSAATDHGILKAWTEKTLGFTPSTDKPYFLVKPHERLVAGEHAKRVRAYGFSTLVLLQLDAPSGYVRSFRYEDWDRVVDLIPEEVGIVYPGPIDLAVGNQLKPRKNLFLLPGYDIGATAALFEHVDFALLAHGGLAMLAHAVDKKEVIHAIFTEAGSPNILWVPEWTNLVYPTHQEIDWPELAAAVQTRLTQSLPNSQPVNGSASS